MLESLTEKLSAIFKRLSGKGRLTEKDVDEALRQIRLVLLEADVNFKVVKDFVSRVRERAVGAEVLESLAPAQQVVKIVNEELVRILGGGQRKLNFAPTPPTTILLVGLQGSGKTTTTAKLGLHLRRQGHRPLLVAADPYRPAAAEQLKTLGRQLNLPVHSDEGQPLELTCSQALARARELGCTVVLFDTAGRLHVEEQLMEELVRLKQLLQPTEVLLVADAMTGQEAVRIAQEFHEKVGLTGAILTKMDGDARGGTALSIAAVTGVPLKFIGVGEKPDALEPFYPDRLASRILGMGDVLSLIEKAQAVVDQKRALELEKKLRKAKFDLEDFLEQLQQIKRMGPLSQLAELIPGLPHHKLPLQVDDKQLRKVEAIVLSMTPEERRNPEIIDGSRRRRIAQGSGTTLQDVNRLLNQFRQMQKLMKQLSTGRLPKLFPFRI
ncbi:MAG: signal recognition particle protein [Chloroflexi bacterium]|nr:MAG: signal recognition particle protein [Chloroflexota bacterium]